MVELEQHRVREHAEGERQHAEEDAGVAHARVSRSEAATSSRQQRHADEHDLELLDAQHAGDDGSAIGAEPEEHGVPEGEQAARSRTAD